MKICFMCDLHLPSEKNALQYDVLQWAIDDILKSKPDLVAYAGDVTCDGNGEAYDYFLQTMEKTEPPFLYIPGNSDLRCPVNRESIIKKASPTQNNICGTRIFAINDCDNNISESQLDALDVADENSVVFMHHPMHEHKKVERLFKWRENHPDTMLFYGHLHYFKVDGSSVSLPAMTL